jgi:hypothetical protein
MRAGSSSSASLISGDFLEPLATLLTCLDSGGSVRAQVDVSIGAEQCTINRLMGLGNHPRRVLEFWHLLSLPSRRKTLFEIESAQ